jgi:SP family sugar:H+ symporter-like MFS transporter
MTAWARTRTVILVSFVAALGGFLFGYDSAVINGAVGAIAAHFGAGPAALGLAVASALLGAAAGALGAGRLADRFGRLFPMRLAAVLFTVSAVGAGLSSSLLMLSLFRVIGGVAIGIALVFAPTYIAEIAPAKDRGKLASLQQLAIVTGIFLSLLVDYAIAAASGSARASSWLAIIFANAPLNAAHQPQLAGTNGLVVLWAANLFAWKFVSESKGRELEDMTNAV